MAKISEENRYYLNLKKEIIRDGNSEVFKEWQRYGGISEEEFVEALEWLAEGPMTPLGRPIRAIGMTLTRDGHHKAICDKFPEQAKAFPYDESKIKSKIKKLEYRYEFLQNCYGEDVERRIGSFDIDTGIRDDVKFIIDIKSRI